MQSEHKVALVTGAARRIGACIARTLHGAGYNVVIHCRRSREAADALAAELNAQRADSATVTSAELLTMDAKALIDTALGAWQRLDLLVNNASGFFPTAIGATTQAQWDELMGSNLRAPFFLSQAAAPHLAARRGAIVNIVDVYGQRPLAGHTVYSTAKAGLAMLTRALAKELAPEVRVNGVAPGAILWPEQGGSDAEREKIVAATPLRRTGQPEDIASAVVFLAESEFVTGQILAVDGGRSL